MEGVEGMKNYIPDDETILTGWDSAPEFNSPEPESSNWYYAGLFKRNNGSPEQFEALRKSLKRNEMENLTAQISDDRIIASWHDGNSSVRLEIRPSELSNWMDGHIDTGGVENCLYMVRNLTQCVQKYLNDKL